ncbi:MAG: S-methyl-5-thioribose-1-phosphate isomerase [Pseudohongiellaceae bacterium]
MIVDGKHYQSIWYEADSDSVRIIDQTRLPHEFSLVTLTTVADAFTAIAGMQVRGAPLIGVAAAFGMYLALRENPLQTEDALNLLASSRPTAVNLRWALNRVKRAISGLPPDRRARAALEVAQAMAREDVESCRLIGMHGLEVLKAIQASRADPSAPLNILTHCNAGWLATVDGGTALSVIYQAQAEGIPVHVWVDETRPRNQGASLTCWELQQQQVPCTLVVDNAGGHLMQQGMVDLCLVGSDRVSTNGDVCNKIGTYLKALAAHDNNVPFYAAMPVSTIDYGTAGGIREIPIEQRDTAEVTSITGRDAQGEVQCVALAPERTRAANYGFDVTPARLVSGLITDRGVCAAESTAIAGLRRTPV